MAVDFRWTIPEPLNQIKVNFTQTTCSNFAKVNGFIGIRIREEPHDTTRINGVIYDDDWHITADFQQATGEWHPYHIYTNDGKPEWMIEIKRDGRQRAIPSEERNEEMIRERNMILEKPNWRDQSPISGDQEDHSHRHWPSITPPTRIYATSFPGGCRSSSGYRPTRGIPGIPIDQLRRSNSPLMSSSPTQPAMTGANRWRRNSALAAVDQFPKWGTKDREKVWEKDSWR